MTPWQAEKQPATCTAEVEALKSSSPCGAGRPGGQVARLEAVGENQVGRRRSGRSLRRCSRRHSGGSRRARRRFGWRRGSVSRCVRRCRDGASQRVRRRHSGGGRCIDGDVIDGHGEGRELGEGID